MTTSEVSALVRRSPETLRYWRHRNEGPPSFRLGRRVMYRRGDVSAWIEAARRREHHDNHRAV